MPRLPFEQARGHALFPIFSMLAHNCMANCRYVASTDGRFVTVRALRHIHEGEQLSIDYNDVLLGNFVSIYLQKIFLTKSYYICICRYISLDELCILYMYVLYNRGSCFFVHIEPQISWEFACWTQNKNIMHEIKRVWISFNLQPVETLVREILGN